MSLYSLRYPRQLDRSTYELEAQGALSTTYWRQHHIRENLVCAIFSIAMIIRWSYANWQSFSFVNCLFQLSVSLVESEMTYLQHKF